MRTLLDWDCSTCTYVSDRAHGVVTWSSSSSASPPAAATEARSHSRSRSHSCSHGRRRSRVAGVVPQQQGLWVFSRSPPLGVAGGRELFHGPLTLVHGSEAGILRTRSVYVVLVNKPCKPCKPYTPYKVSVVSLDHQRRGPTRVTHAAVLLDRAVRGLLSPRHFHGR